MRYLLFDIEGTITSLSFVKDELFPYARRAMAAFLRASSGQAEIVPIVDRLAREMGMEATDVDRIAETLVQWIDQDRKQTDLKELQGMIWAEGYRTGAFRGHLYPDVLPFWRRARAVGHRLAIYSSGSEQAQRLLLAHSVDGDVSGLIECYYDTRVGAKGDVGSYRHIAADTGVPAGEIHFFSDAVVELDAARAAGMGTRRLLRPGVPIVDHDHTEITSFNDVDVED